MNLNRNVITLMNRISAECEGYKLHSIRIEERSDKSPFEEIKYRKGDVAVIISIDKTDLRLRVFNLADMFSSFIHGAECLLEQTYRADVSTNDIIDIFKRFSSYDTDPFITAVEKCIKSL